jgi:hypothetical protein
MNKILVEIMLPAAGKTYDVYIPLQSRIGEIINLLAGIFSDLADGDYKPVQTNLLCDAETGIIFDMNKSPADLALKNGSKLMLI